MDTTGNGSLSIDSAKRNVTKKRCLKEKLPHDLVIEILSWLHVKHLWPLRCVSKSWLHLLTKDPQFAKLQFDRFMEINNNRPDPMILGAPRRESHESDSNLIMATDFMSCDKAFPVEYPFYQPAKFYQICGISNGMLCICSCDPLDGKEVYIWNPLVNDHITIPCLPEPQIGFYGYRKYTEFGFGFVQDVNVYKVVRLFNEIYFHGEYPSEEEDSWTQISVYTIGMDSVWRTVEVDIPHYLHSKCALVNGALHWQRNRPGTDSWDLIVTFDLKEEVISEFLLPDGIQILGIVELSGLLCATDRRSDEQELHIWVMKEYGVVSSWSKQYIIGKVDIYRLRELAFTHNGEFILTSHRDDGALYNPETNTVKDRKGFQFELRDVNAFLGSIISPTAISQAGHTLLEEGS